MKKLLIYFVLVWIVHVYYPSKSPLNESLYSFDGRKHVEYHTTKRPQLIQGTGYGKVDLNVWIIELPDKTLYLPFNWVYIEEYK